MPRPTRSGVDRPSASSKRAAAIDRALVLLGAVALDLLAGEPPRPLHPVAWLGGAIDQLERGAPEPGDPAGLRYGAAATLGLIAASAAAAWAAGRALRSFPRPLQLLAQACLLKPAFALRGLRDAGSIVQRALESGSIGDARDSLRSLVSRDTTSLSGEEIAAAAVESLAENTTDSFLGTWLAFLLFGLPGAWAFRAVNTLDSRWGYRGRYERLGRTAALLDDACAAIPARLSAILLIAAAWVGGESGGGAMRVMLRDRARTASPNAGWTMAAMAGALRRRLAKRAEYVLNAEGGPCSAEDIARAQRLVAVSATLALAMLLPGLLLTARARRATS